MISSCNNFVSHYNNFTSYQWRKVIEYVALNFGFFRLNNWFNYQNLRSNRDLFCCVNFISYFILGSIVVIVALIRRAAQSFDRFHHWFGKRVMSPCCNFSSSLCWRIMENVALISKLKASVIMIWMILDLYLALTLLLLLIGIIMINISKLLLGFSIAL